MIFHIRKWCNRERSELMRLFYACAIDQSFNLTCFLDNPFKDSAIVKEKSHEMHRFYMTNWLSNFLELMLLTALFPAKVYS